MRAIRLRIAKHRKSVFMAFCVLFIVFVFYLLRNRPTGWSPDLAFTLIAAGIPGLYFFHREWVKQPNVIFLNNKEMSYQVAPLWRKKAMLSVEKWKENLEIEIPHCARPAVFSRATVKNVGEATASNCMVRIKAQVEDKEEEIDFACRWARPNNPERYDLLPGEKRDILLFKTYLIDGFYFVVFDKYVKNFLDNYGDILEKNGSSIPIVNNVEGDEITFPEPKDDIFPEMVYPIPPRPERKGQTVGGGWRGKEVFREDREKRVEFQSIKAQVMSQERKMNEVELQNVKLEEELLTEIVPNEGNWQPQWFDVGAGNFVPQVMEICKDQ